MELSLFDLELHFHDIRIPYLSICISIFGSNINNSGLNNMDHWVTRIGRFSRHISIIFWCNYCRNPELWLQISFWLYFQVHRRRPYMKVQFHFDDLTSSWHRVRLNFCHNFHSKGRKKEVPICGPSFSYQKITFFDGFS